jgi:hypothetical protein
MKAKRRQPVTSSVGIGLPLFIFLCRFVFFVYSLANSLTGRIQGYAFACLYFSLQLHQAAACITRGLNCGGEVDSRPDEDDIYCRKFYQLILHHFRTLSNRVTSF